MQTYDYFTTDPSDSPAMESEPELLSAEPNYFTCTLGEAASRAGFLPSTVNPFTSIVDVIDRQAETNSDRPAIGFAHFESRSTSDGVERGLDAKCTWKLNKVKSQETHDEKQMGEKTREKSGRHGDFRKCADFVQAAQVSRQSFKSFLQHNSHQIRSRLETCATSHLLRRGLSRRFLMTESMEQPLGCSAQAAWISYGPGWV